MVRTLSNIWRSLARRRGEKKKKPPYKLPRKTLKFIRRYAEIEAKVKADFCEECRKTPGMFGKEIEGLSKKEDYCTFCFINFRPNQEGNT